MCIAESFSTQRQRGVGTSADVALDHPHGFQTQLSFKLPSSHDGCLRQAVIDNNKATWLLTALGAFP